MTQSKRKPNDAKLILILILTGVIIMGVILALLYKLLLSFSPTALRVWVVAATLALPLASWASWHVSRSIARTHLDGVDKGIDKVMHAAQKTADVRDRSAAMSRVARVERRTSQPVVQTDLLPNLPPPTITHQRRSSSGEIIDV